MKAIFGFALLVLSTLLSTPSAQAVEPGPVLAQKGRLMFSDDFARPDPKPKWNIYKGAYTVKDGIVTIEQVPSDNHAAALQVAEPLKYKDFVAEFSVKFNGGKSCSLMVNDKQCKESYAGHLCKATIAPKSANIADQKYGSMRADLFKKMKEPETSAAEKKQLQDSIKDLSRDFKMNVDLNAWHQFRVELVGDEMLASLDGKPVAYMKSKGIDHPTKNVLAIQATGKFVEVKDVKIWEASAGSDWAERRSAVTAPFK